MTDDVEAEQETDDSGQDPEAVSEQSIPDESAMEQSSPDESQDSLDERVPQIEVTVEAVDEDAETDELDTADTEAIDIEVVLSDAALPDVEGGPDSPKVPWWPFLVLLAVWLGVVTGSFFTLSYESAAAPLIQQEAYPYVILAGLVLAIFGPILSLTVWFIMWLRAGKGHREGLLTVSLVRGAGVTLFGVLAWWGTIVALDALRLGLIG